MACWALTACGSAPDCFDEEAFCVALVTDTLGVEDHGINQEAWAGLQEAQANGLADKVDYIESVDSRDYAKNIAYFADRGYDLVFASGIALADETLQSADRYPDSAFAGLNQPFEESRPNLVSIAFPEDQMGFAAGVVAAQLTQTHIVAAACETSGIDSMWRYCEGFRAGVKFADENVKTLIVYREGGDSEKLFIDEAWGHATGVDLIRRGADVIFAAGGVTAQGALRAASEYGIRAIGAERDQAAALGESGSGVVASFYGDARLEVQEMMRRDRAGQTNGAVTGRIQYGTVSPTVPPSTLLELDSLLNLLASGGIATNVSNAKP